MTWVHIPESPLDLIDGSYTVALSMITPDGQPQTTSVWCNRKEEYIYINVMKGFRKEKNMHANPKASILAYDPKDPLPNIEIRGCVIEMTEEGAIEHDDELAQLYMSKPDAKFFGDAVLAELRSTYIPIKVEASIPTLGYSYPGFIQLCLHLYLLFPKRYIDNSYLTY